ncbi:MAG: phosphonate metabolism protein/1,5-bisphosphokinase (PRPP-forming) PhnN [Pseudomonadota bacterium]
MSGRFIAVVGPSGVGKDSLMDGLCTMRTDLHRVRRVITRAPELGGEEFEHVSECLFAARAAGGDFALHWQAHGLSYGIPNTVRAVLARGQDALANLSRGALQAAEKTFDEVVVLHVTASPKILARRLARRGRERGSEIDRRLARPKPVMPVGLRTITIDNSGPLAESVAAASAALYPERV